MRKFKIDKETSKRIAKEYSDIVLLGLQNEEIMDLIPEVLQVYAGGAFMACGSCHCHAAPACFLCVGLRVEDIVEFIEECMSKAKPHRKIKLVRDYLDGKSLYSAERFQDERRQEIIEYFDMVAAEYSEDNLIFR